MWQLWQRTGKITALGELCCVALSFCCVVLPCLSFSLSISWIIKSCTCKCPALLHSSKPEVACLHRWSRMLVIVVWSHPLPRHRQFLPHPLSFTPHTYMFVSMYIRVQSMIVMWQLVEDLRQLMRDLSLYSPQFLQIMINLLEKYRDSCNHMYRGMYMCST